MSDGIFVVTTKGKTIYQGGDEKLPTVTRRGRRNAKTSNEIIYPIFKEAIAYCQGDSYWIKIFEDASKGNFQKMYRYANGTLSHKQKTKVHSKEICQDDPELCFKNVQDFMKSNGCYSERDHIIQMMEIEEQRDKASQTVLEWKNIKSRKTKKLLVSKYIAYLGTHYSLDKLELSNLINIVTMAYSIGLINSSSVQMKNNQISDINILCFDAQNRDFFLDSDIKMPKINKAILKKINDESTENDETDENLGYNIKPSGVTISKSRTSDWSKFTSLLGKRMAAYSRLEDIDETREKAVKTKKLIVEDETPSPSKTKNSRLKIIIKSKLK